MLIMLSLLMSSPSWAMDLPEAGSQAAELYAERCSVCHALPHPKRLDWSRWRHILRVMKRRTEERGVQIPVEEWRAIAAYLRRNARDE